MVTQPVPDSTMIFSFIPVGVLVLSGVLALFRPTRTIAAYLASIAVCSTGLAIALAIAGLLGGWLLYPYSGEGGDGKGLAMALWGVIGLVVGGFGGVGTGAMLAHRLTRGRPLF